MGKDSISQEWLTIRQFSNLIGYEPATIRKHWLSLIPKRFVLQGPGERGHYRIHRDALAIFCIEDKEQKQ